MSNNESFIDEVTEEVRRDKLFLLLRKYGWIGIAVVLLIVGGAAWNEWQKASARAASEAFGDSVLDALDLPDAAARRTALEAVAVTGTRAGLRDLLLATDPVTDRTGTLAALDRVIADAALPIPYHDLAVLRRVSLAGADIPLADRRAALETIAAPGRPYRVLAREHLALLLAEEGDTPAAIAALQALTEDQEAPAGLRRRVGQVIVALGGPATE